MAESGAEDGRPAAGQLASLPACQLPAVSCSYFTFLLQFSV